MKFKSLTNFTFTRSAFGFCKTHIDLGGFGFGLPESINIEKDLKNGVLQGNKYMFRVTKGRKNKINYEIFTPQDNVILKQ